MENLPSQQQNTPKQNNPSDEIDLGQLFKLIGKGFNRIFIGLLRFFLYIKKNIFILIGLGVLGILAGYGLKQISSAKMKTEVIVRPNIESKDYLYDVVAEIEANIKAKNKAFFEPLDIEIEALKGFEITVVSLGDKKSKLEDELKYLELLRGLDVSGAVSDVVRNEILSRNSLNHKITFSYKDNALGYESAKKLMEYINSNPYFNELIEVYLDNAENRIQENKALIKQLDELITQYSSNLAAEENRKSESRIVLENEEQLDIRELFDLKNELIQDIELKNLELKTRENAIKVINFGQPQEVKKPFFEDILVAVPLILVGGFFAWSFLKYLDRAARAL